MPHLSKHDRQLRDDVLVSGKLRIVIKKLRDAIQLDCIDIRDRDTLLSVLEEIKKVEGKYLHGTSDQ